MQNSSESDEIDPAEFCAFFSELQAEISENGDNIDSVNEEEARELFLVMKAEYNEVMNTDLEDLNLIGEQNTDDDPESSVLNILKAAAEVADGKHPDTMFGEESSKGSNKSDPQDRERESNLHTISDNCSVGGVLDGDSDIDSNKLNMLLAEAAQSVATITQPLQQTQPLKEPSNEKNSRVVITSAPALRDNFTEDVDAVNSDDQIDAFVEVDEELEDLRQLLPAFSDKRLRRILRAFRSSLGDPSLLDLIPIVREQMPDYLTATWLKKMSLLTARYVMLKASEEGLVDQHVLNSVLELETLSGSLDRALNFYETAFKEHNLVPNEYSTRLVLQMFLKNNRLSRALALKERLKERGKLPDIPSYGSLIEFCAKRGQIGSSMLLLKECIRVHGSPPNEASLSALRVLCRKAGLEDDRLLAMIGEDPVEWLKHGETNLKREYSKRGRRDTLFARNRLVQL